MSDENDKPEEEEMPPFRIQYAKSGRSKCKSCRRAIEKDSVRLGILFDGRYGPSYSWHHIICAAKHQWDSVVEAYDQECIEPETDAPPIEELKVLYEKAQKETVKKVAEKKEIPYAEFAPSGRAKCKLCDELIEKGSLRVLVAKNVEFYGQVRKSPINVHPGCVTDALSAEDSGTESEGFVEALRANSVDISDEDLARAIKEIGLN